VSFICDSAYCWTFKSIISSINLTDDSALIKFRAKLYKNESPEAVFRYHFRQQFALFSEIFDSRRQATAN
jgi:hypothetical protein